ncbi:hypothetical protein MMC17_001041 [Xylographa soralifera]|nr:hypothetical protein [Xylographa soralifera]
MQVLPIHSGGKAMSQGSSKVTLLAACSLLLVATIAYITADSSLPLLSCSKGGEPSVLPRADNSAGCFIQGNPDFYGIGIRSGIYLQWITSLLANLFWPEAIDPNLDTNTIFLLALFVATVLSTVRAGDQVSTAEVIVLLQLCFGFLFSILTIWGFRTRTGLGNPVRFPLIGSLLRLALATAISLYGVWFWFVGVQQLQNLQDSCSLVTFIFTRLDINGGVSVFYKVQSLIFVIVYCILFLRELILIGCFLFFTVIWTSLVAMFSLIFTSDFEGQNLLEVKEEVDRVASKENLTPLDTTKLYLERSWRPNFGILWSLFARWTQLSFLIFWSQANSIQSAGDRRPRLQIWFAPFYNAWIFVLRASIQFLCLFLFKRCPPLNFPRLIDPLSSGVMTTWKTRIHALMKAMM